MKIICGKTEVRRKRGTTLVGQRVEIGFSIKSNKLGEDPRKDCPRICELLRIRKQSCDSLCISAYKR